MKLTSCLLSQIQLLICNYIHDSWFMISWCQNFNFLVELALLYGSTLNWFFLLRMQCVISLLLCWWIAIQKHVIYETLIIWIRLWRMECIRWEIVFFVMHFDMFICIMLFVIEGSTKKSMPHVLKISASSQTIHTRKLRYVMLLQQ